MCSNEWSDLPNEDDEEKTAHEFVNIVNSENWEGEPNLRYKIVEWMSFAGITLGIVCLVGAAIGGVVWVWKQIL